MRYLVDTDWIINYLSGHAGVEARINSLRSEGLAVSLLSLAELYEGVHRSRDPKEAEQRLWEFLEGLHVLGLDAETCRIFGKERARLRAAGALPGDIDLLIGSTALRHNLILLTSNLQHFQRIQGLQVDSL